MERAFRILGRSGWWALLVAVAFAAGCSWHPQSELIETHVALLERLAIDARDTYVMGEATISAADVVRLQYPLERARRFEETARRRSQMGPGLEELTAVTDAYAALVSYLDEVRTEQADDHRKGEVDRLTERVLSAAAKVRLALAQRPG